MGACLITWNYLQPLASLNLVLAQVMIQLKRLLDINSTPIRKQQKIVK
jgi:hypothetical protein